MLVSIPYSFRLREHVSFCPSSVALHLYRNWSIGCFLSLSLFSRLTNGPCDQLISLPIILYCSKKPPFSLRSSPNLICTLQSHQTLLKNLPSIASWSNFQFCHLIITWEIFSDCSLFLFFYLFSVSQLHLRSVSSSILVSKTWLPT